MAVIRSWGRLRLSGPILKFLIDRRGADAAKQWAAQRALEVTDAESRAAWLRVLQAIIDLRPSPEADMPLN